MRYKAIAISENTDKLSVYKKKGVENPPPFTYSKSINEQSTSEKPLDRFSQIEQCKYQLQFDRYSC